MRIKSPQPGPDRRKDSAAEINRGKNRERSPLLRREERVQQDEERRGSGREDRRDDLKKREEEGKRREKDWDERRGAKGGIRGGARGGNMLDDSRDLKFERYQNTITHFRIEKNKMKHRINFYK